MLVTSGAGGGGGHAHAECGGGGGDVMLGFRACDSGCCGLEMNPLVLRVCMWFPSPTPLLFSIAKPSAPNRCTILLLSNKP